MEEGTTFVVMLISLVVWLLVGAIILRASISLYNMMARGSNDAPTLVPEPPLGRAMVIIFGISFVSACAGVFVGLVMHGAADAVGARGGGINVTVQLISLPIGLLIMTAVLSASLPTSFGRAALITLCSLIVSAVLVGTLGLIAKIAFR